MTDTSISERKYVPVTPPKLHSRTIGIPQSPLTTTPTPKSGGDLRSIASMPSLQSFNSIQSHSQFQDFDILDFGQLGNDALYYDLDHLQTPELDTLSPSFYEMQGLISPQHPLLTPDLSGSVGSGISLNGSSALSYAGSQHNRHANLMANNIEGLGIAESVSGQQQQQGRPAHNQRNATFTTSSQPQMSQSQLPSIPSPDGSLRRSKTNSVPRVTKKSSKQSLKQRRSRTNLSNEAVGSNATPVTASIGPTSPSSSTVSSQSSITSMPTSPSSFQREATLKHKSSFSTIQQPVLPVTSNSHPPLHTPAAMSQPVQQQQQPPLGNVANRIPRMMPTTPYHSGADNTTKVRGKSGASPAMQSPWRPGQQRNVRVLNRQQTRIPAAAAQTALYMPAAPQPDVSRQNSMAAAAAAAASASASSNQQPVTPLADRQIPRVSPTTLLLSNKAGSGSDSGSTIKVNHSGSNPSGIAPSPTPASRMHSTSKLVSSASDSSPAKGVWQQAPRNSLPLSQLPKPTLSPRKSASTSSIKRDIRRKQNKVIPEMSSSLNQFQVDLKPKQRVSKSSPSSTSHTTKPTQVTPNFESNGDIARFQQVQLQQSQYGIPVYDISQIPRMSNNNNMADIQSVSMLQHPLSQHPTAYPRLHSESQTQQQPHMINHSIMNRPNSVQDSGVGNNGYMTQHLPASMPQMPAHLAHPVLSTQDSASRNGPPSLNGGLDKVQPQGEPPQHVWASRPQPPNKFGKRYPGTQLQTDGQSLIHHRPASEPLMPQLRNMQVHQNEQLLEQQQQQLQSQHQEQVRQAQLLQNHSTQRQHTEPFRGSSHMQASQMASQAASQALSQASPHSAFHSTSHLVPQSSSQSMRQMVSNNNTTESNDPLRSSSTEEPHDLSASSDFMTQFMNDDWNANDIDLDSQWDLMDALETPV